VGIKTQVTVPLFPIGARAAFGYGSLTRWSAVAKIAKYIMAEGLAATLRKVKSRHLDRELLNSRWLVSVFGRRMDDDKPVWGLAPFDLPFSEFVLVPPQLTFELPPNVAEETMPWLGVVLPFGTDENTVPHEDAVAQLQQAYRNVAGLNPHAPVFPQLPDWLNQRNVEKAVPGVMRGCFGAWRSICTQITRPKPQIRAATTYAAEADSESPGSILVGAGNYARVVVLPSVRRAGIHLNWVVDLDPLIAQRCKEEYGFTHATTDISDTLADPRSSIASICTYHHTHAELAQLLLKAGKKVIIEKPPVTSFRQLANLCVCASEHPDRWAVGYNRRYAPDVKQFRKALEGRSAPVTITCIIQEVRLPEWHWYNLPIEGGRTISNLCHWIDLGCHLVGGALPEEISCFPVVKGCDGDTSVTVRFADGSALNLILSMRGDETLGMTEYIDVRCGDLTGSINDFGEARICRSGRSLYKRKGRRNRGHGAMYSDILRRFVDNQPQLFGLDDLWLSSALMLIIREMHLHGETTRDVRDFLSNRFLPSEPSLLIETQLT
jgi:predicted dehydrogenase